MWHNQGTETNHINLATTNDKTLTHEPGPILEFNRSVQYVQKGYPNMVTHADMILKNWWEFDY